MAGLYVIATKHADAWSAPCKIGISANWTGRLNSLQAGNPKPIGLFGYIDVASRKNARQAERFLHHRFAPKRLTGEWFQVDPEEAFIVAQLFVTAMIHSSVKDTGEEFDAVEVMKSLCIGPGAEQIEEVG